MRLNQYLAKNTELSRRSADKAIVDGRVEVNGVMAELGDTIIESDKVTLDSHPIKEIVTTTTIILNKPVGYVCSRNGQGSKTIYELIPSQYHLLNPVGRLDKDSSGVLLMSNDGQLANQLTHPSYGKKKKYIVKINKPLEPLHQQMINDYGVTLEDGLSKLQLTPLRNKSEWEVVMSEGRNRQIRRTFQSLGYKIKALHRTEFGIYNLSQLKSARYNVIT